MSSSHAHTPIVVTHEDRCKFNVAIGQHRLTIDQPVSAGGNDAGPGPLELLGASLGACVAYYVYKFCETRALPHDRLRVEVTPHAAIAPSRIGHFDVRITLPLEMPERFMPLVERVAMSCPAHNTLSHGATVSLALESVGAPV